MWQETTEYKGYEIIAQPDMDPFNPRKEWDNLSTLVMWHRRYQLGDEHVHTQEQYEQARKQMNKLIKQGAVVIYPIKMYDHGGITITTTRTMSYPFTDPWDAGIVGYAYATKEQIRKWFGCKYVTKTIRKQALQTMHAEIEEYDRYLTGNVYCGIIKDPEGEVIDSCGSYYNKEVMIEDLKATVDYYTKQTEHQLPLFEEDSYA